MDDQNKNFMNVFEFYNYKLKSGLPHENNITRGLARILNDNVYIFKRFIEIIKNKIDNEEIKDMLVDIKYKYDVSIQTVIKNIEIENYKHIIGVALTAKEFEIEQQDSKENQEQITDIVVENYNDLLIVIEAKKDDKNCEKQLSSQIKSIDPEGYLKNPEVTSIEWKEIIDIIEDYRNTSRIRDVIIDDYYEYLNYYFKEWFKVNKLSMCDNDLVLDKRLKRLLQDIQKVDEIDKKINIKKVDKLRGDYNLFVDWEWTNHIPFKMNYEKNEFEIGFYPVSSGNQYKELVNDSSLKFITEKQKDIKLIINNEIIETAIIIDAYIRINGTEARYATGISIDLYKEKEYYEEIANKISGRWNLNAETNLYEKSKSVESQEKYDLYSILNEITSKPVQLLQEELEARMKTEKNELYKQIDLCLAFYIIVKTKIDKLEKYDEDFDYRNEQNNVLAEPIRDFIVEIKRYIES